MGHTIGSDVDQYCYVEEVYRGATTPYNGVSYNSWIKCRIATDYNRIPHLAEVIAYASTFEEAVGISQKFEFVAATQLPIVTFITETWTGTKWQLVIDGTGITDTDIAKVQVKVGGNYQKIISVGPT